MFYKLEKVSMGIFNPNPRYWAHISRFRCESNFCPQPPKSALLKTWENHVLVEMWTKLEYSRKMCGPKKTCGLGWYPLKYLRNRPSGYENIEKSNWYIFFDLTVSDTKSKKLPDRSILIRKKLLKQFLTIRLCSRDLQDHEEHDRYPQYAMAMPRKCCKHI